MKISQISLNNFQKHSDLTVTFNDTVNIITGLTDTGKSAIFRALMWVLNFSSISEKDYRKEGTKQTSVKVWLDNGFIIERIRSNTLNRYILSKEGCEDKVFDNFGKQTPEDILCAIGISEIDIENQSVNLNFASQDQLNFLLDSTYSDTFKAKLFNKLTGNEALDILFKDLNKDSLRFKRDIKETEETIYNQEEKLSEYSVTYKTLKKKLSKVNEHYNKIKEDLAIYEQLKELSLKLQNNKNNSKNIKKRIKDIKIISDDKIQKLRTEVENINKLNILADNIKNNLNISIEITNKIKEIKIVSDEKIKMLQVETENMKKLQSWAEDIDIINSSQKSVSHKIEQLSYKIEQLEHELEATWGECKVCPLCKKEL
jgi:DNA repair protein SbcC/Rad50